MNPNPNNSVLQEKEQVKIKKHRVTAFKGNGQLLHENNIDITCPSCKTKIPKKALMVSKSKNNSIISSKCPICLFQVS